MFTEEKNPIKSEERAIRVLATANFRVDGETLTEGQEYNLTPRQYAAVARHCKLLKGEPHPAPQSPEYCRAKGFKPGEAGPLQKALNAVTPTVLGLIAFALLALGALTAQAAPPSTYGVLPVTMLTNGCTATTAITALTSPIGLTKFDQISFAISYSLPGGSTAGNGTNWFFAYPCDDGSTVDTNHPVASFALTPTGGTNALLVTNFSASVLGSTGYLAFGVTNITGGTLATNIAVKPWAKPIRSGT